MLKVTKSRGNRKLIIDGQKENAGSHFMSEILLKTRTIRASWSTTIQYLDDDILEKESVKFLSNHNNSDEECMREIERNTVD